MKKWARAKYQPALPLYENRRVTLSGEHIGLSKQAASEGIVLLKNTDGFLPLSSGSAVALFGKGVFDYVKGGGGSGDVHTGYVRNFYEGFKEADVRIFEPACDFYRDYVGKKYEEGSEPGMIAEPEPDPDLILSARKFTDTAIFCLSRFSGEGWDRSDVEYNEEFNPWGDGESMPKTSAKIFPKGDFYLTDNEEKLLHMLEEQFDKIVVILNVGGIIDTKWIPEDEKIKAALLPWQGGMEGAVAAALTVTGKNNPSGRLPDTFARELDDYPSTDGFHTSPHYVDYKEDIYVGYRYFETIKGAADKVVFPFGFGLSYTTFKRECVYAARLDGGFRFLIRVENTGKRAGKEVVSIYLSCPQGKLGKPSRQLAAFEKTKLLAGGEAETLELFVNDCQLASYDDLGKVAEASYVIEKGEYGFFLGGNVRDAVRLDFTYRTDEDIVFEKLSHHLVPVSLKKRLLSDGTFEELPTGPEKNMNECIFPKMIPGTEEGMVPAARGRDVYMLMNPYAEGAKPLEAVLEGRISLDEFTEQLGDEDLRQLLGGQSNVGVSNTWGIGNNPEYGIPNVTTADGPAGVRLNADCGVATTAFPCATLLASTWNKELVYRVGKAGGEELKENNLQIWLTPAVNIHRNPMCGRNFEYYSEDPYLAGKTGAEMVKGIQSNGVAACVKHFAANNKETNRKNSDSRVSERALREIYLKVFEIIVKEADPWSVMTAYNAINGQRTSESYELITDILRGEWGFKGMVTTDWWNRAEHYKEILAGNDVKMANGYPERVEKAMEMGALGRSDLIKCAKRILELILKLD
ncbi:MAG: glycoside hydrolase family 3 C-terminal domain-containing protein [Lachnospiraceae bacterium]|nr:glycoside hydrolase family 3 C-terminal domain-containing protein [Lachnospiraceae bacterium]